MSCTSKGTYLTRSKAKNVCKKIKSTGKGNLDYCACDVKLIPYRCRICNMWHLTKIAKLPGIEVV